jgi:hypothetical protein
LSDESFKFTPDPGSKFPKLIMRAFTSPDQYAEWIFTPPNDAGWFDYKFEAQQKDGVLHINFGRDVMMPKPPEYDL